MNSYEARQNARRDRLEAAADRAQARSDAAYERADLSEGKSGIPMGQPILVGHHSERRHRRMIERADKAMCKSVEEGKKADELRQKAAAVGTGGISSDDPDAPAKLRREIEAAEILQAFMKNANRVIRAAVKKGTGPDSSAEKIAAFCADLKAACDRPFSEAEARSLLTPDFCNRVGFASYQLSNNNANINRMKKRLADLEATRARPSCTIDHGLFQVRRNTEANRVQIVFDGKPSAEIRAVVKAHGFRWAPSAGAWQRHLNPAGIRSANSVVEELQKQGQV